MKEETANTLPSLRDRAAPTVRPGFADQSSFELMQRGAKLLSHSTLVPAAYRAVHEKTDRYGNVTERTENPSAMSNCVVALNMANRVGADPLMVMQNLYIVEGRPSWSSQYIIAAINSCGRYSPLRFDLSEPGPEKDVAYTTYKWVDGKRQEVVQKVKIADRTCVAWAIEKETGQRLESPPVSMAMAVAEGWYTKNGSKWQTMPDVMLRYRAASFFGKLYAPELLMGLQSAEEMTEIIDIEKGEDGIYSETVETVKERVEAAAATSTAEEPQANVEDAVVVEQPIDPADDPYVDLKIEIMEIGTMGDFIRYLPTMSAKAKRDLHGFLEEKQAKLKAAAAKTMAEADNASALE